MRRSVSSPSFTSKKLPVVIPRNVSTPVFLSNLINDVVLELQVESITQTPAYMAGACGTIHKFPLDLINSTDDNVVQDVGACMASPPDGECTSSWDDECTTRRCVEARRRRQSNSS